MNNQDYSTSIELNKPAEEVFDCVTKVAQWWTKDIHGSSEHLHDEFVVQHRDMHFSRQKVVELVPNQKIVWLVTESKLSWLKENQQEWDGTMMTFELVPQGNTTLLNFSHVGLLPENECYKSCSKGWNQIIQTSLSSLINDGTGAPV